MRQHQVRVRWIAFIGITHLLLLAYLFYFQDTGGLLLGLPTSWVVLFVIMANTFAGNSIFAWYYLGKPDLRDVFGGSPKEMEGL